MSLTLRGSCLLLLVSSCAGTRNTSEQASPPSTPAPAICAAVYEQGPLRQRFEKHLPVIGHVQIAAVPSRAEPDEGEINYPGVFAALDRLGWSGWTACEYRPRGRTEDGLRWGHDYGLRSS